MLAIVKDNSYQFDKTLDSLKRKYDVNSFFEEGEGIADSFGIKFLETSAKDAVNVEKAFTIISK